MRGTSWSRRRCSSRGRLGGKRLKLALYAHGGLNGEEESIARVRLLRSLLRGERPSIRCSFTWKTGVGETLSNVVEDCARKLLGPDGARSAGILEALGDAKDRAVEALAHVLGKGLWTEMRENAEFGKVPGHVLEVLARQLAALEAALKADGKRLELHFIGHSAGSILLGHLLERMAVGPKVKTCTLFAPACSVSFAVRYYLPAADVALVDLERLWIYFLSDANEKRDGLPSPALPAYGKSLLYLVSRALDDERKMPLLGLARALDPKYARDDEQWAADQLGAIREWQARWKPDAGSKPLAIEVALPDVRSTRTGARAQATHGSFDNNIDALTETIERIKAARMVAPMEWLDYE
jgi:hypothetical protein